MVPWACAAGVLAAEAACSRAHAARMAACGQRAAGSGDVRPVVRRRRRHHGNPTKAGTFNFTVKATDGGLTATMAYQITVTVQGPPDQLLCSAANGSFLISGVCVLPDSVVGQPYQGHLSTSRNAGGTLSIVAGALPAGCPCPPPSGRPVRSSAALPASRAASPAPPSPCRAPGTRASLRPHEPDLRLLVPRRAGDGRAATASTAPGQAGPPRRTPRRAAGRRTVRPGCPEQS